MPETRPVPSPPRTGARSKAIRVLHVDEARLDRALIHEMLTAGDAGFEVEAVTTREHLEEMLETDRFHVVVSEITVSGLEGEKVLDLVRERRPGMPVVICTAAGSEMRAAALMQAGAAGYVPKTEAGLAALPDVLHTAVSRAAAAVAPVFVPDAHLPFEALIAHAQDLILTLDVRALITYAGPSITAILGYAPTAVIQRDLFDFIHLDDEPATRDALKAIGSGDGRGGSLRFRFRHREGAWRTLDGRITRWEDGGPARLILNARDVTDQRWAEDALRESEQQYRVLIEQSADAIYVEQAGRLVLVNRAWETLFGYARAEVLGHHFDPGQVLGPGARPGLATRRKQQAAGRHVDPVFECKGRRRDGQELDLEGSEVEILWKGRPAIQGMYRDVTARKRAERELWRYARRLEVLRGIDQALLGAHSTAHIAEAAITPLSRLVPCAWAGVMLQTPEVGSLSLVAQAEPLVALEHPGSWQELFGTADLSESEHDLDAGPASPLARALATKGIRRLACFPLRFQEDGFGYLAIGIRREVPLEDEHRLVVREVAEQLSVALHSLRLFEAVEQARVRLESLSHRLVEVQEQERRHIALELHDEIGQILTALNYTLDFGTLDPVDQAKLERAQELVELITMKVRDLSLNLRPSMLDDLGLLPALMWYFQRYQDRTGIRIHFVPSLVSESRFRPEVETAAYRIIQEALNNVARYAGVKEVTVELRCDDAVLHLAVVDEGRGYDPQSVAQGRPSAGLSGMQERAALVGGTLHITAAPGDGVSVEAVLPR